MADFAALVASDGDGEAVRATVQSPGRDIGSSVIPVNSITNWPTGQCIVTTGTLQPNNTISNVQVFYGTASGTSITINSFAPGYTDLGNTAGDVVVIKPTTEWANLVAKFVMNATGLGTPDNLTADTLTVSGLFTPSGGIASNSVSAASLATNAITLGKTTSFSSFSTASTSDIQATGATLTVTVPAGGRDVEVKLDNVVCVNNTNLQYVALSLWDGAVGTGTLLARKYWVIPVGGGLEGAEISAQYTPSTGSHTYNVGVQVQGGTGGFNTYIGQYLVARVV